MDDAKTPAAEAAEAPEFTHYLVLADGRVIEHSGAIPTHYSDTEHDRPVPVISVRER